MSVIALGPELAAAVGRDSLSVPQPTVITRIERLSPANLPSYRQRAFELFTHSFPHPDEREPVEDIVERIEHYAKGQDADGAEFHAHVYLDRAGNVLGYSQGSVMSCGKAGLAYFWQYGAVADEEFIRIAYGANFSARKLGVSKLMHHIHTLTLRAACQRNGNVPCIGEIWESEQKGFGADSESIRFTLDRLTIHNRSGGRVLMGIDRANPTRFVNLHLQPRLTKDSEPIALHLMLRTMVTDNDDATKTEDIDLDLARNLVLDGFVENFTKEGFAKEDVLEAREDLEQRLNICDRIVLLPAAQVPDAIILAETDELFCKQLLDIYQVENLAMARSKYMTSIEGK